MSYSVSYADFLADPLRIDIYLVDASPYNPATEAVVNLYYSSGRYITAPTDTPASTPYVPRATVALNVQSAVVQPGTVADIPAVAGGEIRIGHLFGDADALAAYLWDGRAVTVRHAGYSPRNDGWVSKANARVLYVGEAAAVRNTLEELVIEMRQPEARLSFPCAELPLFGQTFWFRLRAANTTYAFNASPDAKLDLRNDLTLEAICYFESLPATDTLLAGFSGGTFPFSLAVTSGGNVRLSDSTGTLWTSTATISVKRKYHVTVALDATSLKFYLWDHYAETLTEEEDLSDYTGRAALLGAALWLGRGTNYMDGYLMAVRVWNEKHTATEIASTRNRRLTSGEETDANLIALWRCEEGTGSTIADGASGTPVDLSIAGVSVTDAELWSASLEGAQDVTGTVKPLGYGRMESVPPILVHLPTNIYLVAKNKWSEITQTYEGGNFHDLDNSYTDLRTFLDATTADSKRDTLIFAGGTYFRLGSTPTLPLTVDGKGDASGTGYVETAGQIARRLVTTLGPEPLADPGELDTARFTALDTANSAPCGIYLHGDEHISDAAAFILGSVGASGLFSYETGLFTVNRFGGVTGSSVQTFDERHIIGIEPLAVDQPFYAVSIGWGRQYVTLGETDLAGIVLEEDRDIVFRLQNEYRYARVEDLSVRDAHPRAGTFLRQTGLALETDAIAEATRLLPLVNGASKGFKLNVLASRADQVENLDIITVSITEPSLVDYVKRLGLGVGTDFIVLGVTPVRDEARVELTIWRGEG